MLGILTILAQRDRIKVRELAEHFEVSVRTIHRDIECISMAGIPVVTYPGGNGGIGIVDGFIWDKNIFTSGELENILLGLKSLDSVIPGSQISTLLKKLSLEPDSFIALKDDIVIDLASLYKSSLGPKIKLLRQAISNRTIVSFEYYSKNGQAKRQLEPYFITFKWSAWYVFGFCRLRQDFRLFKLNRLINLELTGNSYTARTIPDRQLDLEAFYLAPGKRTYATLQLDRKLEYVMVDNYGKESYEIIDENFKNINSISGEKDFMFNIHCPKDVLTGEGDKSAVASLKVVKLT